MSRNPQKTVGKRSAFTRRVYIDFYGFPNHETDEQAKKKRSDYLLLGTAAEQGEVGPSNPEWCRYHPESMEDRREFREKLRKDFCNNLCNQLIVGKLIALGKQFKPIQSTKFEIILRLPKS